MGFGSGVAPVVPYVLWRHRSPKLRDIVRRMMVESNNHFAEQLLRAIGATRGAGTEANGELVVRAVLRRGGVPQDGLRVVDGSGLAPGDRVSALTLATLLARTAAEPRDELLVGSLPRVGIEGTVRRRQVTDARGGRAQRAAISPTSTRSRGTCRRADTDASRSRSWSTTAAPTTARSTWG